MDNYSINLAELIESPEEIQLSLMNFSADYDATSHHSDEHHFEHSNCYHSNTLELVSPGTQLFLVLLYSVTAMLSLIGNLTVIAVQLVGHESAASVRRHLISLAIADVISGVLCVPFSFTNFTLRQWVFPALLCPVMQYAQLLSVFVTAITLTVIGVERYMATLHPFSRTHQWLKSHTGTLLLLTWITGALYACLPLSHTRTSEFTVNGEVHLACTADNEMGEFKRRLFMNFNFILTFLVPSLTLTVSYAAILKRMKRQKAINDYLNDCQVLNQPVSRYDINSTLRRRSKRMSNRLKTIKLMFTIIILFDICWFPIKLYQFLIDYDLITFCSEMQFNALIYTYITFHWLAMANSFINPIVYSFMCRSFRNDFKKLLSIFEKSRRFTVTLSSNERGAIML